MKSYRVLQIILIAAVVAAFASCASAPTPESGDLSFRLIWTGRADLNLSVVSPLGERVDFKTRSVGSGGTLYASCDMRNNNCPSPVENIFWPRHTAPQGDYRFVIDDATPDGIEPDSGAWVLEVRALNRVVKQQSGTTSSLRESSFQEEISFQRQMR